MRRKPATVLERTRQGLSNNTCERENGSKLTKLHAFGSCQSDPVPDRGKVRETKMDNGNVIYSIGRFLATVKSFSYLFNS